MFSRDKKKATPKPQVIRRRQRQGMGKQRRLCTLSHGSMLIKVGPKGERVKGETPSVWRAANLDAAAAIATRDKESCNRRGR